MDNMLPYMESLPYMDNMLPYMVTLPYMENPYWESVHQLVQKVEPVGIKRQHENLTVTSS